MTPHGLLPREPADARLALENLKRALDKSAIVATTDARGVILSVNDKFVQISGYGREELVGRTHRVVNSGHHPRSFFASMWRTLTRGDVWEGEIRNRAKDGHDYWVHTTIVPLLDEAGRPEGYISIRFEITARKRAEEALADHARRLEQSNRDLESFASLAAHDLQEPLRKMQAFADRLLTKESGRLSEQGVVWLGKLVDAASRMRGLVSDILTLSRVATRGEPLRPTDLDAALRGVLRDLELRMEETGARVEFEALGVIRADPSQIHQLLLNLVGNALKFRKPGAAPRVRVRSYPAADAPGAMALEVSDDGIGFDPRHAERVFQPFQRLHTRSEYDGTGIGLAVCRRIAERHGGRIEVRTAPGEGATFVVTFPGQVAIAGPRGDAIDAIDDAED